MDVGSVTVVDAEPGVEVASVVLPQAVRRNITADISGRDSHRDL
jgi:hypothetical protein